MYVRRTGDLGVLDRPVEAFAMLSLCDGWIWEKTGLSVLCAYKISIRTRILPRIRIRRQST